MALAGVCADSIGAPTPGDPLDASHAKRENGPLRGAAIGELKDLGQWTRELPGAESGIGIIFDQGDRQESVSPETILDAYFHGRYLHSGNELSEMVRRLDDLELPRFTLYNVMRDLTRAYYVIANVVDRVLAVPELLDADSRTAAGTQPVQ